jgi:uncharacterized protein (TIGR03067 family)
MNLPTLMLLTAGLLAGQDTKKEDLAKKDLEKLQGNWQLVAVEENGEKLPSNTNEKTIFQVKDDKWSLQGIGGKITLDPTQKPKAIDGTWEVENTNIKELCKAIYDLDGDKLRVAYLRMEKAGGGEADFSKDRPKDFSMKPVDDKTKPHLRVLFFERVK